MTRKKPNRLFQPLVSSKAVSLAFMLSVLAALSCSGNDTLDAPTPTANPTAFITDEDKLAMIRSMRDLDGTGRLYELDYTADYKLDDVLASNLTDTRQLFSYIGSILFDTTVNGAAESTFGAGCSAFAAPDAQTGDYILGRNYDFCHATSDGKGYRSTSAIVVRTAPKGGKKSISIVDGLNLGFGKGFYTDGTTDLSLMMGLPYAALDGINEDGFAISILALNEKQTRQSTGKPKISSTVAIRMLLDRATDVDHAISLLQGYDMDMTGQGRSNYHYFMADAKGNYAIVEYTMPKGETIPRVMEVLRGNDSLRCVTNFYVSPTMVGTTDGWGSTHGKDRYWKMRGSLQRNAYRLPSDSIWAVLQSVAQPPTGDITSQTQWSAKYNLSARTLQLAILREFGKKYDFRISR